MRQLEFRFKSKGEQMLDKKGYLRCDHCNVVIKHGAFCEACRKRMEAEVSPTPAEPQIEQPKEKKRKR